jgi:hypothetical protein
VHEDFFEGDHHVVVAEWVEGTDLARLLRDRGTPGLRGWVGSPPSTAYAS